MSRFLTVLVVHLFSLVALFLPDRLQGPITLVVSGVHFRVVDVVALTILFFGTIYLFATLIRQLVGQLQNIKKLTDKKDKQEGK